LRRTIAALSSAAVMLAFVAFTGPSASANHNGALEVQVGAPIASVNGAASMRFLGASRITVHQGDTITFDIGGAHTATSLPANTGADDWLDDNFRGLDKPFYYVNTDPDEAAGIVKDNFLAIDQPSDPTCGGAGEPACVHDGTEVVNSGSLFGQDSPAERFDFTIDVDAQAGDFFWVVCLAHPHMRMKVTVVANNAAATTQEAIDTAAASQLAQDTDWAEATHAKYKAKRTSHVAANGVRYRDAWAGVDSHTASIAQFYPRKLVLKKGQRVRWRFDGLVYEDHTVSMPIPAIFGINFGTAECDTNGDAPDGDVEPIPPATPEDEPTCPPGAVLEFDFDPADFLSGVGDGVLRGRNDMEHSGIRGANIVTEGPLHGNSSYDVRFAARSGDRPFQYLCFLHDRMGGKIVVK